MHKIRLATAADHTAVRQFWYRVYVKEMQRHTDDPNTNHERQELDDPLLGVGNLLIALDRTNNLVATVINTKVKDNDLAKYAKLYELDQLTPEQRQHAAITTKLMVDKKLRNTRLPVAMVNAAYKNLLETGVIDHFIDCNDHLVRFFNRFGYYDHVGRSNHEDYGVVNTLRLKVTDGAALKQANSPFYRIFLKRQLEVSMPTTAETLNETNPEQNTITATEASATTHNAAPLNAHQELQTTFDSAIVQFNNCVGMRRLWNGELNQTHYAALMREIFHHARENPQLQALATVFFRGQQRSMVKPFLRHAISEVGHDMLALNDAAAAGMDISNIAKEHPLPHTTALIAFPFYQINNLNALGYLGYLYFLESMPTSFGPQYMELFEKTGITDDAMTFLSDHATIDVGHTKAMQGYITALIKTEADLNEAQYAMRVTGQLYATMLTDAFASADRANESNTATTTDANDQNFGINSNEVAA